MGSLLNEKRPPVFCPGCSHERIVKTLDKAFQNLGLKGEEVVIVTDIGCSGFFDVFFNTHAFHGLHGRALTYATGIKMARPELKVIVTMGDGGLGIGGAHLLSACRRNLDLTLLILNNFNFGMTGGQFSATTPADSEAASGFLNRLDQPMDPCRVAAAAGAPFVSRCSAYEQGLAEKIVAAISFEGFAVMDIWGLCTGRFTKANKLTPSAIDEELAALSPAEGPAAENARPEYGSRYRELAAGPIPGPPPRVEAVFDPPESGRREIIILGSAGQRVVTAGELLCLAGMSAGFQVTQKNEYSTFVLRGPSVTEVILSPRAIAFTGLRKPSVAAVLSEEGAARRREMFGQLDEKALIIKPAGLELPTTRAKVHEVDFKAAGIKNSDWALASLAVMARLGQGLTQEMLKGALALKFQGGLLEATFKVVEGISGYYQTL